MLDDKLGGVDEPSSSEVRSHSATRGDPGDAAPEPDAAVSRLPPYLLTSGRAEPVDHTLEIESQVMTTELGRTAPLSFEQRDIVELCATSMSVGEVAASLHLHIGVTRVLVADLAAQGYLLVQRPSLPFSQDTNVIERVIRGLKALR
ncbi:DUF742 domain-containing protein [Streptomyces sp. KR80]|uniref:DUF742 domain-containing protein n=1 Tax=Streptomyces sp. KR80 TaxID=3457426 RepID=UPI003FD63189